MSFQVGDEVTWKDYSEQGPPAIERGRIIEIIYRVQKDTYDIKEKKYKANPTAHKETKEARQLTKINTETKK
jgi:hypothetical protein